MILTNYWKIYEKIYGPFLSPTGKRQRGAHREFLEALVELLFLCNSEEYAETVPGTSFKDYPQYSYVPHKSGPKPRFPEPAPPSLTDLSRKTPFIFKGDPGRPRVSIPAKITPISRHYHIKTTTNGHCLIYRNSNEVQIAQRARVDTYGAVFKLSEDTLEEIKSPSKDPPKGPKRIWGIETKWKYSEYQVPICKAQGSCWKIAHRRLFSR